MKYQKRNLWLVALAGALAIVFASGCDDTTPPGGTPSPTTTPAGGNVAKVRTWENLGKNAKFVDADDVQEVVVSNDKKWVYFVADGKKAVRAWNVGAASTFAANLKKDAQWKPVNLVSTSLTGNPGLSNTLTADGNNKVEYTFPTDKGVMLSVVRGGGDHANNGIYYFEGDAIKAAWASQNVHIATATGIAANKPVFGLVAKKDNDELPIAVLAGGAVGASLATSTLAAGGVLNTVLDAATTPLSFTKFVASMIGEDFIIAGANGIHTVKKVELGTTKTIATLAATEAAAAKYGALGGTPNNAPISILVDSGKAYIGFEATGNAKGGVVIFTPGGNTVAAHADWAGKSVVAIVKLFGKVYGVTNAGDIWEVKAGGEKGEVLNNGLKAFNKATANTTDTYIAGTAPTASVTDAAAVGDNLIVTTSDKTIFVLTTKNEAL